MRKFYSLFATLALITSATSTSVVACGSKTKTNNNPKTPSPTQNIVNKIDNKTVTLDDNDKTQPGTFDQYEGKTANDDEAAIKNALVKAKYVTSEEAKYLSFDNKINLQPGDNNVQFTVNMPGVAPATGNLVVKIDQLKQASSKSAATTSVAQKEAQALDNKTVGLNDLGASESQKAVTYENTKTTDQATTAALQSTISNTV